VGEAEVNLSEFVASGRKTRAYILQVTMCKCAYVRIVCVRGACVWFGGRPGVLRRVPSGIESQCDGTFEAPLASAVCV
jgi:hypothetical protein